MAIKYQVAHTHFQYEALFPLMSNTHPTIVVLVQLLIKHSSSFDKVKAQEGAWKKIVTHKNWVAKHPVALPLWSLTLPQNIKLNADYCVLHQMYFHCILIKQPRTKCRQSARVCKKWNTPEANITVHLCVCARTMFVFGHRVVSAWGSGPTDGERICINSWDVEVLAAGWSGGRRGEGGWVRMQSKDDKWVGGGRVERWESNASDSSWQRRNWERGGVDTELHKCSELDEEVTAIMPLTTKRLHRRLTLFFFFWATQVHLA